jgi:diketogulonate reductase-like aldo/keto reductase
VSNDLPKLIYGTAWKEERTAGLVGAALAAGFRAIDTANQRKHYHEAGVGEALAAAVAAGVVRRDEIFLQSKYTYAEGQDARLPFDPGADYPTQVRQSYASSLVHLGVERLDSLLLHGPRSWSGLTRTDLEVWRTMEALRQEGQVERIGVSNVDAGQLVALLHHAVVRPWAVQNRCFARHGWDREVRAVCRQEGIAYQGFSLLTANREVLASPLVTSLAARHAASPAQVVFRFAQAVGMLPLTGTSDPRHMREDLAAERLPLADDELSALEAIAG